MLCLYRRSGEDIFCTLTKPMPAGTRIVISVVHVKGAQVKLGIAADRSITIDRSEVDARKQAELEDPDGNKA